MHLVLAARHIRRAHPRGCGEHPMPGGCERECRGSSPRVRGTWGQSAVTFLVQGLIPAGAGNISKASWRRHTSRAHPRGCGEHKNSHHGFFLRRGSSPRVRGTFTSLAPRIRKVGLIPAGAGNIRCDAASDDGGRAHPRGCGEHNCEAPACAPHPGSSPRVRGTSLGS